MIGRAASLALGQLSHPAFLRVFLLGIGLAAALLIGLALLVMALIGALIPESLTIPFTSREIGGVDTLASFGSLALMALLSIFLMAPVTAAFIGLFLEQIAAAVEEKHYSWLPPARPVGFWSGLGETLGQALLMTVFSLLGVVILIFSGGLGIVLIWLLNGYLLGREYFALVALRRLSRASAGQLRRGWRLRIWAAGTLLAIPLSIPLLNLAIPVIGAAMFTHLFHFIAFREGLEQERYPRL